MRRRADTSLCPRTLSWFVRADDSCLCCDTLKAGTCSYRARAALGQQRAALTETERKKMLLDSRQHAESWALLSQSSSPSPHSRAAASIAKRQMHSAAQTYGVRVRGLGG